MLEKVGEGIRIHDTTDPPLSVGDMVNIERGKRGGPVKRPKGALHTVGMDISYGEGISPGGHKYCLILVDAALQRRNQSHVDIRFAERLERPHLLIEQRFASQGLEDLVRKSIQLKVDFDAVTTIGNECD